MRTICAWCHTLIRSDGLASSEVSHGMCFECRDWLLSNTKGIPIEQFIEGIQVPILIVDGDSVIRAGNALAIQLLGKPLDNIMGFRPGNIVQCAYARLPGGCGQTTFCSSCTIRQTIMATYDDAHPRENVKTAISRIDSDTITKTDVSISTWKKDGMILLQISEIEQSGAHF